MRALEYLRALIYRLMMFFFSSFPCVAILQSAFFSYLILRLLLNAPNAFRPWERKGRTRMHIIRWAMKERNYSTIRKVKRKMITRNHCLAVSGCLAIAWMVNENNCFWLLDLVMCPVWCQFVVCVRCVCLWNRIQIKSSRCNNNV